METEYYIVECVEDGRKTITGVPKTWVRGTLLYWPIHQLDKQRRLMSFPDTTWTIHTCRILQEGIGSYSEMIAEENRRSMYLDTEDDNLHISKKRIRKKKELPPYYVVYNDDESPDYEPLTPQTSKKMKVSSVSTSNKKFKFVNTQVVSQQEDADYEDEGSYYETDPVSIAAAQETPTEVDTASIIKAIDSLETKIFKAINILEAKVDSIQKDLNIYIARTPRVPTNVDLSFFPISTVEVLMELNDEYLGDKENFQNLQDHLSTFGGKSSGDNIRNLAKFMFSNTLLALFNWYGGGIHCKLGFKEYVNVIKVMFNSVRPHFEISQEEFNKKMQEYIRNAPGKVQMMDRKVSRH